MDQTQDQIVEITMPEQTGLPISNPQGESDENQGQSEELSTQDTQLPTDTADTPATTGCDYCDNKDKYQSLTDQYVNKSQEKGTTPWIEELALSMDKDEDTLKLWFVDPQHAEFNAAIKKLVLIQKLRLLEQSTGRFTHAGAIFLLDRLHNL